METMIEVDIEDLARYMHEKYEESAKHLGWDTQKSCKVSFDDLPEANKQTMLRLAGWVICYYNELLKNVA